MKDLMFIHGMFLTPKCWERWVALFEKEGYRCIAPAWPLHEADPAHIRESSPAGLGELKLAQVVDRMREAAASLDDPVLIGHSLGGLVVQRLIAEGIGSAGIPICSVAPDRMMSLDWGLLRNTLAITNPLKGDEPFPMDAEGFHKNFCNTLSREDSDVLFEEYGIPESRNVLRDILGDEGKIDLEKPHAPLFFLSAENDQIIPPELCRKNADGYEHKASRTDYKEFKGRSHFIGAEPGWEEVADAILHWLGHTTEASQNKMNFAQTATR